MLGGWKKLGRNMRLRLLAGIGLLVLALSGVRGTFGQDVNPLAGDVRAVRAGGALFRAQCATCHGADGRGIESIDAPDLRLMWARDGVDDEYVFTTIRDGVPGSIMPPHELPETELWMLVAFLASQVEAAANAEYDGDAVNGRELFAANCAECHRAGAGGGGVLGPSLNGVTRRRAPEALTQSIREPSRQIARGFGPVTVSGADGETVTGVLKNEDAFSLQLVTEEQELRAFRRGGLRRMQRLEESLMPAFPETDLSAGELADLLAYLHENQ